MTLGEKTMPELKIRIDKEECYADCTCGDCGYLYEEYVEA